MSTNIQETIVAIATAQGEGALGVIRLSGKDAIEIANSIFKGKDLTQQESHTLHYGFIKDGNKIIDEVMVSIFQAPKSYTTEDSIEISCHGSLYIQEQIVSLLITKGARLANAGEFTLRAFLNGRINLSQAEAVADLIASNSESSKQIALNQLRGGFSTDLAEMRVQLINFASLVELELDFSEEDVDFADRDALVALMNRIIAKLDPLILSFKLGNAIKNGINVAIVGKPNAGKSTLLNALLNDERAIVSDIAGTTRDTIEEVLNIKGVLFRFVDTAGLRETTDEIEKIGVEKAIQQIDKSSVYVYLFDMSTTNIEEVETELSKLNKDIPRILLANKTDLVSKEKQAEFKASEHEFIFISAKEKLNIENLKKALYNKVIDAEISVNDTIVSNIRHYNSLKNAKEAIEASLNGIALGITGDLLAQDIRIALKELGNITGDIDIDEDILGNIFSKFCIGK
ncbi:MAG: tRNA uridine-5-carboxymethylaminomethyl(34) synthesis GTPase MnmE [Chitinophagales bacterium]